jgi:hypothetical protein
MTPSASATAFAGGWETRCAAPAFSVCARRAVWLGFCLRDVCSRHESKQRRRAGWCQVEREPPGWARLSAMCDARHYAGDLYNQVWGTRASQGS